MYQIEILIADMSSVIGALFLVVTAVVAIKYRRKRLARQRLPDNDQNPLFKRRDPGSDTGSIIWGGSVANTEWHPPVPVNETWYNPKIARSVGDSISRLWGGSQTTSETSPTEFDQNEKITPPVPPMPPIPAEYIGSLAPVRELNGHPILSQDFNAPPAAYLPSDTTSVREERLSRVRNDLSSRMAFNRQSTISIARFRTADSWVEDQTKRLHLGS